MHRPERAALHTVRHELLGRISSKLDWNGVDRVNIYVLNDLISHYYLGLPLKPRDFGVLRGTVSGSAGVDADG